MSADGVSLMSASLSLSGSAAMGGAAGRVRAAPPGPRDAHDLDGGDGGGAQGGRDQAPDRGAGRAEEEEQVRRVRERQNGGRQGMRL